MAGQCEGMNGHRVKLRVGIMRWMKRVSSQFCLPERISANQEAKDDTRVLKCKTCLRDGIIWLQLWLSLPRPQTRNPKPSALDSTSQPEARNLNPISPSSSTLTGFNMAAPSRDPPSILSGVTRR